MALKKVSGTVIVIAFAGVQTAHAMYPFDLKKNYHLHSEKYEQVVTADNIGIAQTTGGAGIVGRGDLKAGEAAVTGTGTVR